jgi:hypothetical protein
MDFSRAINELEISAAILENNAPINEREGKHDQAKLERENATNYREAAAVLKRTGTVPE